MKLGLELLLLFAFALLLWLAAWERAAHQQSGRADLLPHRIALWTLLALGLRFEVLLAREVTAGGAGDRALPLALLALAGLAAVAAVATLTGGMLGTRIRPRAVRSLLAPFFGLSQWTHWLGSVVSFGRARWRRRREANLAEAPATLPSPESAEPPSDTPAQKVRDLADVTAGEVMIPRSETVALPSSISIRDAVQAVRATPHAVYPVYAEQVDQPLGVVRMIDLSGPNPESHQVGERVHSVPIVPESMRGLHLLLELWDAPIAAAIVVDEFGGVAGFLTVEDLVEVLIGDFEGEHEIVRRRAILLPDGRWRIEGNCRIDELNSALPQAVPAGEYETVAGLFLDRFGRIPEVGDEVLLPRVRLEVESCTPRRITSLLLSSRAEAAAS